MLESGGTIRQETLLFDAKAGETRPMRSKEEAHDYRYFPDPDLLPLVLDQAWVDEIAASLPELPDEKKSAVHASWACRPTTRSVLVAEKETADYFEAMLAEGADAKAAANWLNNEYFGRLNKAGLAIADGPVVRGSQQRHRADGFRQRHLGKDRQGRSRHRLGGRRRSARHRREPRTQTGDRYRRDRAGGRCGDRREPRQGCGCESEARDSPAGSSVR